jgi:hypothetical protein
MASVSGGGVTVDYSLKPLAVAKRHIRLRSFTTVSRLTNELFEKLLVGTLLAKIVATIWC